MSENTNPQSNLRKSLELLLQAIIKQLFAQIEQIDHTIHWTQQSNGSQS